MAETPDSALLSDGLASPETEGDTARSDERPFVVDVGKDGISGYDKNLYLYHDEMQDRPRVSGIISNYSATIPSATDPDAKAPKGAQLGTLLGVYLPCIQNIFGVILFIRFTWIVGTSGIVEGTVVIIMCCMVTLLTSISMSAIATNGVVPAGGSYYMISRALGPEFGGAVGVLFFMGTSIAASMYIVGAVEILITYMLPELSIFGDFTKDQTAMFNNFRFYGTITLMILVSIVYVGVAFVSKFAAVSLVCVLLSILAIYVGIFYNIDGNDKLLLCTVGERLVSLMSPETECHRRVNGTLWNQYCTNESQISCDNYFSNHDATLRRGIRGLSSSAFKDNLWSSYRKDGDRITVDIADADTKGERTFNEVLVDITTSMTVLVGIYFPSVTGIMAGSNRSGDLADAQKSIPIGTLAATLTTSFVYISCIYLYAGTFDGLIMRDKFGQSVGGRLVVANVAWPNEWVIMIGAFLSTLGAGLQSLTGAPRLLQAIAKDNIIPFLNPIGVTSKKGEPTRALFMCACITECGILIGAVDYLNPIISMFFLMCYGFVNLACALQTLLRTPNWRPRFRFYHWTLSLLGLFLSLTVMFMTSWYYALIAMAIAGVVYKYIEYRGAEKEWGDGIRGLSLSAARFGLLRLEETPPHTKNFRPQVMVLASLNEQLSPKYKKLITFASQLKAGKGLMMVCSVLEGDFTKRAGDAVTARQNLRKVMDEEKVKGFAEVVVANNAAEGLNHMVQTAGLGGLKPNTVVLGWPMTWKQSPEQKTWYSFVESVRNVAAARHALIVPKGINFFPDSHEKVNGHIDIWWIVHDGGLLILISFLLKQHKTWRRCKLRIYTVAQIDDNSIQMKKDLKLFLYNLRIAAQVEVVEMSDTDISAYTYERTLVMEQRSQLMKDLNLNRRGTLNMVQAIVDHHHSDSHSASKVRFQEDAAGIVNSVIEEAAGKCGGESSECGDGTGCDPIDTIESDEVGNETGRGKCA